MSNRKRIRPGRGFGPLEGVVLREQKRRAEADYAEFKAAKDGLRELMRARGVDTVGDLYDAHGDTPASELP
jgi:hypothetical protein